MSTSRRDQPPRGQVMPSIEARDFTFTSLSDAVQLTQTQLRIKWKPTMFRLDT
jgi:hypothetical protein